MSRSVSDNMWLGSLVRLAGITKDDIKVIASWRNDAGFIRLADAGIARPQTEEQVGKWIEDEQKSERSFMFAIRRLEDDVLVGAVGLDGILWNQRVAWLGIEIGERENWNKGYGGDAMHLVIDYGFQELNLHRIQLTVFEYNERAIHLYEKLGFQREGVYREFLYRDGQRYDMYLYGLLRHEWEARQTAA